MQPVHTSLHFQQHPTRNGQGCEAARFYSFGLQRMARDGMSRQSGRTRLTPP